MLGLDRMPMSNDWDHWDTLEWEKTMEEEKDFRIRTQAKMTMVNTLFPPQGLQKNNAAFARWRCTTRSTIFSHHGDSSPV